MIDVGLVTRRIQAEFKAGTRTPARLRVLLRSVQDAWAAIRTRYDAWIADNPPYHGQTQLEADMAAFETRLEIYRRALAPPDATTDQVWPVVQPLLVRQLGPDRHTGRSLHVIDAVFPLSLSNQIEALADAVDSNTWLKALGESLDELPERIGEYAGRAAGAAGRLAGKTAAGVTWGFLSGAPLWLILGIVGLGGYWLARKGGSRVD